MEYYIGSKTYPKVAICACVIKNYIKLSNFFVDTYCKQKVRIGYENNKLFIIPVLDDDTLGHEITRRPKENYGYIYCQPFFKKYNIDPSHSVSRSHWDAEYKRLIITLENRKMKQPGQFANCDV